MNVSIFTGVVPILQTPFHADGSLDTGSLAAEVEHIYAAGARAFAYPAFASEWWKLSESEQIQACRVLVDAKPPGCGCVFSVNSQSTYGAVALARQLQALGADALLCLPPFIVPQNTARIIEHCASVVSAANIPVMLQYSPLLTASSLDPTGLLKLYEAQPNFSAIKVDVVPTGPAVSSMAKVFAGPISDGRMTLLVGYSGLQLPDAVARGATGLMGGAGHVEEDLKVLAAIAAAPGNSSLPAFRDLLPLLNFEMQSIETCIAAHKYMLWRNGVISNPAVRSPGMQLDEFHQQELNTLLESLAATRHAPAGFTNPTPP